MEQNESWTNIFYGTIGACYVGMLVAGVMTPRPIDQKKDEIRAEKPKQTEVFSGTNRIHQVSFTLDNKVDIYNGKACEKA